ncbi:MAG: hypothetical protein ABNH53_07500, partial [Henriciella sp.]
APRLGQRNNMLPEFRRVRVPRSRHENILFDRSKIVHQTGGSTSISGAHIFGQSGTPWMKTFFVLMRWVYLEGRGLYPIITNDVLSYSVFAYNGK